MLSGILIDYPLFRMLNANVGRTDGPARVGEVCGGERD